MGKTIEELSTCPKPWCDGKGISALWRFENNGPVWQRIECDRCGTQGHPFLEESGEAVKQWNDRGLTALEKEVADAAVEKAESQRALTRFSSGDHVPVLERETRARERYVKVLDALLKARAKQNG
jgi:hypothetical protein